MNSTSSIISISNMNTNLLIVVVCSAQCGAVFKPMWGAATHSFLHVSRADDDAGEYLPARGHSIVEEQHLPNG